MKNLLIIIAALFCFAPQVNADEAAQVAPLKVLMITGGGYHDYESQKKILADGIGERARVEFTVVLENPEPTTSKAKVFENEDWAEGYDAILHNECFADYTDVDGIAKVVKAHTETGIGAVMIHCAMHTFRNTESKEWDKLVGVESRRHGPKYPIVVRNLAPEDPIMKGLPRTWTTPQGELYTTSLLPGAKDLAVGYKDGEEAKTKQTCIWRNEYGKSRVFGTTLGHHNETMEEAHYLDMITKGLLWSARKLDEDGTIPAAYKKTASNAKRPTRFQVYSESGVQNFANETAFVAAAVPTSEAACCGRSVE